MADHGYYVCAYKIIFDKNNSLVEKLFCDNRTTLTDMIMNIVNGLRAYESCKGLPQGFLSFEHVIEEAERHGFKESEHGRDLGVQVCFGHLYTDQSIEADIAILRERSSISNSE